MAASEEVLQHIAQKVVTRMAATLYLMGGKDMVTLGFVTFDTRPYLTPKGVCVFRNALDLMPEVAR